MSEEIMTPIESEMEPSSGNAPKPTGPHRQRLAGDCRTIVAQRHHRVPIRWGGPTVGVATVASSPTHCYGERVRLSQFICAARASIDSWAW
jgi:hypothetical protein